MLCSWFQQCRGGSAIYDGAAGTRGSVAGGDGPGRWRRVVSGAVAADRPLCVLTPPPPRTLRRPVHWPRTEAPQHILHHICGDAVEVRDVGRRRGGDGGGGGGDSDEDSDADDVSIVPLYTVMQKLTNDKVKLDKPRDCADFFSKVCKLFVTIAQDKLFQTQFGELVALAKAFLAVFQGFVQHRIHPIEWPHATEDPSIVQTDPFYYLSIDISPGDLLLSLKRYSQPSAPFPFSWTEPNGQRSTLLSTKCDQLIRKREAVVPISSSSAGAASTTTGAAAAAAAPTEPPGTREAIPSVLALHLRRFAIDLDAQWKEKLLDYFSFPYRLDWAPFLAPADHAADHRDEAQPPPPLWYQLHGVIVHAGDAADDGHYVSLIRDSSSRSGSSGGSSSRSSHAWYLCNDDRIRRLADPPASVSSSTAPTEANGHEPIDVAEWLRPWFGGNDEEGDAAAAAQPTTIDGHETVPERRHDAVDVNDDASSSSSSSTTVSALDDAVAMMLFYVRLPSAPPTDDVAATT